MKLSELLDMADFPMPPSFAVMAKPDSDPELRLIAYRSDSIEAGDLFVAIKGNVADGHDYALDAEARGAAAIIAQRELPGITIPVVVVDDSRMALSALSAKFHGFPSTDLALIAVTGTNGKTTTARIIEAILEAAGHTVGGIGTIDWHVGDLTGPAPTTTPESADLQAILATMRDRGASHVVMEVSSHAIDLGRTAHCRFAAGAFTNLSQDHLDWHGDMETYWKTKGGFLSHIHASGAAITLNIDDAHGERLLNERLSVSGDKNLVSVGAHVDAMIRPGSPRFSLKGIRTPLTFPDATFPVQSGLAGRFNLENLLVAAGTAYSLGIDPEAIKRGIENFHAVPGRMERIEDPAGRFVFVDYAHTPDALEKVLRTVRELTSKRVIAVVGCGGDRDRTKRPVMGRIAAGIADLAVITSDNPRTEDPDRIIEDILEGIPEGCDVIVEPDRETAIFAAIGKAAPGDAVVIAGKGHETYQIVGSRTLDFDDRDVARKGLLHHA